MPTGLFNSPKNTAIPLAKTQTRRAINQNYQMIFAQTNLPQRFPGVIVPPGLSVSLRGQNGSPAGNSASCYASSNFNNVKGPKAYTITPDTEIDYPADNLAQIWVMGTAGDGVIASIRGHSIG